MSQNQNETTEFTNSRDLTDRRSSTPSRDSQIYGFTLVELLVVISIIAVLAALVTGAAINALNNSKRASITLEIQQIESAIEDFKNEYGAYPPNVFANAGTLALTGNDEDANRKNLIRHLRKSFSRSTEFDVNANETSSANNIKRIYDMGLSPAESLVFWLQGFSQDVSRPLTGTDLDATTIEYTNPVSGAVETVNNVITIDSRTPRYDFDRGRLRMSRDATTGNRRFLLVNRGDAAATEVQIQLYEYLAPNSEEPFVYFDTSRESPEQVVNNWDTTEFFYSSLNDNGVIYPLKQMRADAPDPLPASPPALLSYVEYVNRDKFQILHCGLDDAWGDFSGSIGQLNLSNSDFIPNLLFPTGPFLGDIRDTLGNFGTGTLEDAQE